MTPRPHERRRFDPAMRRRIAANVGLVAILALVLAGLLNFGMNEFARSHEVRFDLTRQGFHTLTDETKTLLSRLDRKVEVYVVTGEDARMRAAARNDVAARAPDSGIMRDLYYPLLDAMAGRLDGVIGEARELTDFIEYRRADARTSVELPREWARELGLSASEIVNHVVFHAPATGQTKSVSFYDAFAVSLGGPQPNQPRIRPILRGDFVEEVLVFGIRSVVRAKRRVAYFTNGQREVPLEAARAALRADAFDVRDLNLAAVDLIPADCELLVVAGGPMRFTSASRRRLSRWVKNGGRLLLLQGRQAHEPFDELLEEFGIRSRRLQISHAAHHPPGQGRFVLYGHEFLQPWQGQPPHPVAAAIAEDRIPIHFGFSRAYDLLEDYPRDRVTRWVVAHSGDGAQATPFVYDGATARQRADLGTRSGDFPIMLAAQMAGGGDRPARLVVCGSDEWLHAQHLGPTGFNLANLDLFLNVANWLVDSERLITSRPREFRGNYVRFDRDGARTFWHLSVIVVPILLDLFGLLVFAMRRRQS